MSARGSSPQLEFESTLFPPEPGEDEQTNPGIYGRALATWLRARLGEAGLSTGEVIAEDFGWIFSVAGPDKLAIWVACTSMDTNEWGTFVFAEGGNVFGRMFGAKDPRPEAIAPVYAAVKRALEAEPGVRGLREVSRRVHPTGVEISRASPETRRFVGLNLLESRLAMSAFRTCCPMLNLRWRKLGESNRSCDLFTQAEGPRDARNLFWNKFACGLQHDSTGLKTSSVNPPNRRNRSQDLFTQLVSNPLSFPENSQNSRTHRAGDVRFPDIRSGFVPAPGQVGRSAIGSNRF